MINRTGLSLPAVWERAPAGQGALTPTLRCVHHLFQGRDHHPALSDDPPRRGVAGGRPHDRERIVGGVFLADFIPQKEDPRKTGNLK